MFLPETFALQAGQHFTALPVYLAYYILYITNFKGAPGVLAVLSHP